MKITFKHLFTFLICSLLMQNNWAQKDEKKKEMMVSGIGFYNLENLFDTIIDPDTTKILQDEFTPKGKKKWNSAKYWEKMDNMAKVIADLGTEVIPNGLDVLGVSEIENRSVLEDLVANKQIKSRNYQIVHYESPDKRGIDVALLYNPSYFEVVSSKSFTVSDTTFFTRDQLLVSGKLNGELIHVIVAHWPSRRGGEKRSRPRRETAADLTRSIIDSIQKVEPNAKIFFMGDLNDDPVNSSVKIHLKTTAIKEDATKNILFNPWEEKYKKGIGTLAYRDAWNLFDQIIITAPLVKKDYSSYRYYKSFVYNKPHMKQTSGKFKGAPFRTYSFGTYIGGYSDHFPVYLFLVKESNK